MLRIWSARHKFRTWRRIWLAVAEAQHEMGLPVTKEQVEEIRAHLDVTDDDMARAEEHERRLRHDVMAHVHALGDVCPKAKGIIHLGMTSQDVVCNADLLTFGDAHNLIKIKVARLIIALGGCGIAHKAKPTLGFTHYQPAQPVTVGRRIAGWAQDLAIVGENRRTATIYYGMLKGLRGATGTQASYLELFDGDSDRVDQFEEQFYRALARESRPTCPVPTSEQLVARQVFEKADDERREVYKRAMQTPGLAPKTVEGLSKMAEKPDLSKFRLSQHRTWPLTGQTYPRVVDCLILSDLAATAAVLHKIATDIRLLCNRKELDEPFEDKQVGSSSMPYKRNPMRCERICGLSRFVMNLVGNAYDTAATQWLERTLDDSSNRRLSLPEAFLALDGALDLMHNVVAGSEGKGGLIVHEAMVRKNLMAELPFMATENILMDVVKAGGDRQEYHERIRVHAQAAGARVKDEGLENDLIERLKGDPAFGPPALKRALAWDGLMDPMRYVGRSVEQTERFLKEVVEPLREQYGEAIKGLGESGPRV
jgi:adenylosuccinate lyase